MSRPVARTPFAAGTLIGLKSLSGSMTPALERIAEYVLKHPEKVIYQTVLEVADASGSSEASVVRFSRDLGYRGFQDFKVALAIDLAENPVVQLRQERPQDPESVANVIHATARQAIEDTRRLMDIDLLEEVVGHILAARRIDLYGVGNTGNTAQDFAQKLQRLGCAAIAHTDAHVAAASASALGAHDLALGISVSGSSVDTVRAMELAQQSGAYTVALTSGARSPITRFADRIILTSALESPLTRGSMSAKVSQHMLLDYLFMRAAQLHPRGAELLGRTAAAVADMSL